MERGIICAWCNAVIKEGEEPYSHGICVTCKVKLLKEAGIVRDDED